jgi:hypothetical protein
MHVDKAGCDNLAPRINFTRCFAFQIRRQRRNLSAMDPHIRPYARRAISINHRTVFDQHIKRHAIVSLPRFTWIR